MPTMTRLYAAVLALLFFTAVHAEQHGFYKGAAIPEIAKIASEMLAKQCPQQIDSVTTMVASTALGDKIIVHMQVDHEAIKNLDEGTGIFDDKAKAAELLSPTLAHQNALALCSNPEVKPIIDQGLKYEYLYSWDDGSYMTKVAVDASKCEAKASADDERM
jgi:hypothetical protein